MKDRVFKLRSICCKEIFLSPSQGMMPELLRLFFRSEFGLTTRAHAPKNRSYRYGDFIMQNGDYPLPKLRGGNYNLGIYKSEWKSSDVRFWKKKGAICFFDLHDSLESWKRLFDDLLGGKSPFGTPRLKKKV
jgi:hypothetical protein